MRLIFTAAARAQLDDIADWIAVESPARALSFVTEIEHRCAALTTMPRAFPLVPRHEGSGVRRRPFRDYLIFYRVTEDTVEILQVLHGARDYEPLLFPTGDDP